jgi:uncharacterized protein YfaP (DUF2135 family)/uncharacterized protein YegJ (DUF2314 family)
MKQIYLLIYLLKVVLALGLLFGCTPHDDITELSEAEKQLIVSEYNDLNNKLNTMDLNEMTLEDLSQIISDAQDYQMIEKMWIEDMSLMVKFKNGGIVGWLLDDEFVIPPYIGEIESGISSASAFCLTKLSNSPTNNKACLINLVYNDERNENARNIINNLTQMLQMSDYEVTIKNGTEANEDFFSNDLNEYGVIFYIGHGTYSSITNNSSQKRVWLQTGEEAGTTFFSRILEEMFPRWINNEISIMTTEEYRNGEKIKVSHYYISDRFFDNTYSTNSFPNSLFYSVSCKMMKSDLLWNTLTKKGVGVVIGWNDAVSISPNTGYLLFQSLLCGYNVQEAFSVLPAEAKTDSCPPYDRSYLVYRPAEAGDMRLAEFASASVNITFPVDGHTYGNRVLSLSGTINGFETITSAIVEVNGTAFRLSVSNNTSYNQSIAINNGTNTIKITCYGTVDNERMAVATKEICVTGDFDTIPLYTQLRWNTNYSDVDLHLLRAGYNVNNMWTVYDCFYNNKTTTWGAYLDVDDVNGYGPEHITIPSNPASGTYTLLVHYFDTHGAGITDAFVSVSTYNGTVHSFGPYRLATAGTRSGDIWEVCTITFPDGTITPVNSLYPVNSRSALMLSGGEKNWIKK